MCCHDNVYLMAAVNTFFCQLLHERQTLGDEKPPRQAQLCHDDKASRYYLKNKMGFKNETDLTDYYELVFSIIYI